MYYTSSQWENAEPIEEKALSPEEAWDLLLEAGELEYTFLN